jgi:glycosyltransferase involved in cell wall biosynthesis
MPVFSIVIPTYQRKEVLDKTLRCLENQVFAAGFEVLVVNDGPAESLPELGFGAGKRTSWRLIQNERNLGRAATRNRGIEAARGDYVLFLDDDIWAVPGLLQAHFDKQKEIGGGVVIGAVPPAAEIEKTVWHRYIQKHFEVIHQRLRSGDIDFGLFLTGNVSLPKKLLTECEGFDERFRDYSFEDSELGYRLHKKSSRFAHAPNGIGYHYFREDFSRICKKAYESGRSLKVFIRLHPELFYKMNCHSLTMLPWRGMDIFKNSVKYLLFSGISIFIMKVICRFIAKAGIDSGLFIMLPLIELSLAAKGFNRETR